MRRTSAGALTLVLLAQCVGSVMIEERADEAGAATVSTSSTHAVVSSAVSGGSAEGGCGPEPACSIRVCQGHIYECGDCLDNDEDGQVDEADPECLGACQPTEENFYTGGFCGSLVCSGAPCSVDCAFDFDSGSGNDDCYWDHRCDPHDVAPDYYPEPLAGETCAYDPDMSVPGTAQSCAELLVQQSAHCRGYCQPITPNGCDCFGCCELPARSGNWVYIGSEGVEWQNPECTAAAAWDPALCHPCQPVTSCVNPCDACEMCLGERTLAPECTTQFCPVGSAPCGFPCQAPCEDGEYCISGCCVPVPR